MDQETILALKDELTLVQGVVARMSASLDRIGQEYRDLANVLNEFQVREQALKTLLEQDAPVAPADPKFATFGEEG